MTTSKGPELSRQNSWRNRKYHGATGGAAPQPKPISFAISTSDTNQNAHILIPDQSRSQYTGWLLYFPHEGNFCFVNHLYLLKSRFVNYFSISEFKPDSRLCAKIRAFEQFIKSNMDLYDLAKIKHDLWFHISMEKLQTDQGIADVWPNFKTDLNECPEDILNCAGLAMHQTILTTANVVNDTTSQLSQTQNLHENVLLQLHTIAVRILGYGPINSFKMLKADHYGRLVSVRGTIMRVGATQLRCSWMAFSCSKCQAKQTVKQNDGIYILPKSCKAKCSNRSAFNPLRSSPFTRVIPFQTIRLQESMQGIHNVDSGRVPRNIEVELFEDLVDSVCPGDDVTVTGILKVHPSEDNQRKGQPNTFKMFLHCVAVVSNKNVKSKIRLNEFTQTDLDEITQVRDSVSPFRLLVNSLCPSIYGHEMVKAGLVLGLLGASVNKQGRRNECHVLVVGDPGMGKSQMLQACANVSPRGNNFQFYV